MANLVNRLIHFEAEDVDGKIRNFYYDPEEARIYTDIDLDDPRGEFPVQQLVSYSKHTPGNQWKKTRWQRFKIRLRNFIDAKMPYFLRRLFGKDVEEGAIASRALDANDDHPQLIEIENRDRLGELYKYLESGEYANILDPITFDGKEIAKRFKAFTDDHNRDEPQGESEDAS